MPYLKISTNVTTQTPKDLIKNASAAIADALGKSEQYVMVEYQHNAHMVFAGGDAPLAFLQLKSLGLPEQSTAGLSKTLCDLVGDALHIPADRIYIEFANAQRHMWGWNGRTF